MLCSSPRAGAYFTLLLWTSMAASQDAPPIQIGAPAAFAPPQIAEIDRVIAAAINERKLPGCVVCLGRKSGIGFLKAYGDRSVEPTREPMSTDTLFDLASLTKPIATATSVMILVEQGKLGLTESVATRLPEFAANGKKQITVEQLLLHTSGLTPDNPLADYQRGREQAIQAIMDLKPRSTPGKQFAYSDVGFIVLAELIGKVSEQNIHAFSHDEIFKPLGMHETMFLPAESLHDRIAPTEKRGEHWMQGEVHDPRAFALGGIAGHAGLFSTASDLAKYAGAMLQHGQQGQVTIMNLDTWQTMTQSHEVQVGSRDGATVAQLRALGWDKRSGYSTNRGEGMSDSAFGHGGFTGAGLWIDPELDLYVIVLSNRLHPDGKGNVNSLIGQIGTLAVQSLRR